MTGLPHAAAQPALAARPALPAPLPCSRLRPPCARRRWRRLRRRPAGGGQSAVIDVNRARTDPIPIAIPALGGATAIRQLGQDIASVVTNDLGALRPVPPDRAAGLHPGRAAPGRHAELPELEGDRRAGAGHRPGRGAGRRPGPGRVPAVGRAAADADPGHRLHHQPGQLAPHRPHHRRRDLRAAARREGLFRHPHRLHRRAPARATGSTKRLAIMDQDSENNRFLTDGSWLVLTPRFHPTRDEIAFMSYANNRPRVYLFNLGIGPQQRARRLPRHDLRAALRARRQQRGDVGRDAAAVRTSSAVDLGSRASRRLTDSGAIDVSPCYSPDGSQIVFNSDRGGDQQLYVMGAGGGGAQAHQLRLRPLRHAGLVAARRPDRLHPLRRRIRQLLDRRHASGRLGRAHPVGGLLGGGPDLRAERPRADVLARRPRRATIAGPASRRAWCRSTSPASTSAWWRRRPMPRIRPGRRWRRDDP